MSQPNIVRMLQPGGIVPIDIETTAALVAEIKSQQQARADLEAENKRLRELLAEIGRANAAQVAPVYSELARAALESKP